MRSSISEQIRVYFGKCWRIFLNENGWKVFISSAIITFLISCVTGSDMFKDYYIDYIPYDEQKKFVKTKLKDFLSLQEKYKKGVFSGNWKRCKAL